MYEEKEECSSHEAAPPSLKAIGEPRQVTITIRLFGEGGKRPRDIAVRAGTEARAVVKQVGLFPEGVGLWWNGEPVPLDFPLTQDGTLDIVRTFSGG